MRDAEKAKQSHFSRNAHKKRRKKKPIQPEKLYRQRFFNIGQPLALLKHLPANV